MGSQIGGLFGGLFGDAGQNFVDLQGGPDKVFGTKPDVAPFVPVNLSDETGKAVAADLANLPDISALLDKVIPGFSDLLAQGTANTASELRGELPADVAAQVQRSSAYRALQGGYAGTGMSHALAARDLGRTSLDLTQLGNNSAQLWSNLAEQAYSPFTISTGQQAGTTAANNAGTQANKQFQFNVNAAPDPGALGTFNVDAALGQQLLSFGLGAAGGAIGGGGGGGGGGSAQAPTGYNYNSGVYSPNVVSPTGNSVDWRQNATWGSDRRMKANIRKIRKSKQGHNIYRFNYAGATTEFEGVMADEVQRIKPEAVYDGGDGYLRVNYNLIDVSFRVLPNELKLEAA